MNKVVKLVICFKTFLAACSNSQNDEVRKSNYQKRIDAIPKIVDSVTYTSDSQQIVNSVRWGFNNDKYFFNSYYQLGPNINIGIDIIVDRIFYSKDSSKLLSIVILKEPTKSNTKGVKVGDYIYSGIPVLSSRKKGSKWELIPVSWYRLSDYESYDDVKYRFYYFLLENMLTKEYFDFYQCTIEQDCFWSEKNGYWRMGEIIPGYYNYEVKANRDYFKATGIIVDSFNIKDYIHQPLQEK